MPDDGDMDALREGPVRLIGYSNEVGEAFRPLVPRWVVNSTYAAAGTYVVADAAWRSGTACTAQAQASVAALPQSVRVSATSS